MILIPLWLFLILLLVAVIVWIFKAIAIDPKERAARAQRKSAFLAHKSEDPHAGEQDKGAAWD
jgi:hypothetical protein